MRGLREMLEGHLVLGGAWARGGKLAALACVVAASLSIARPGWAQMTFIEDGGSHPILGPAAAVGAVVWTHGLSVDVEDSLAPTPNYVEAFRRQRWDAFRLNRMRAQDSLRAGSRALVGFVAGLKAEGYRRVVLVGHSFGAFISLIAADLSDDVDAVIAVAPAAYGPVAENPARGALNASRLYPLLEGIRRARIMLFYFAEDIFDPGGRGARSEEILSGHQRPHMIFDQPALLETHWAASTEDFATRFGLCMVAFAADDTGAPSGCRAAEQVPATVAELPPDKLPRDVAASRTIASAGGSTKP